ncbi:hypothetical protein RI129_004677 [Pyrocoelia pectoralis]|uniref:Uncharacterized protein n=1 Tax=Pyrocoelia pectoralis TaxID=417401 RepID=A0AAN7VHQ8_9COLE
MVNLDALNEVTYCKPFQNVKDICVGEKYKVLSVNIIKTKYGNRIVIETNSFKAVLPLRFYNYFNEGNRMVEFNEALKKKEVFMCSLGNVWKTTNLRVIFTCLIVENEPQRFTCSVKFLYKFSVRFLNNFYVFKHLGRGSLLVG